jgi:uncharacterized protein Smg (DUF494 family)
MSDALTFAEPVVETQQLSRDHAPQKKSLTVTLAEAQRTIQSALSEPKLIEPLARVGFDSHELRQGLALLEAVREKHAARREAMAAAAQAGKLRAASLETASQDYSEYCKAVRAGYRGVERVNLNAACDITPDDSVRFYANVRKAYTKAQSQPCASTLGKHGFGRERLKSALKTLDDLSAADQAAQAALAGAQAATEARDDAGQTLDEWMTRLHLLARVALRRSPNVVRQLIA